MRVSGAGVWPGIVSAALSGEGGTRHCMMSVNKGRVRAGYRYRVHRPVFSNTKIRLQTSDCSVRCLVSVDSVYTSVYVACYCI